MYTLNLFFKFLKTPRRSIPRSRRLYLITGGDSTAEARLLQGDCLELMGKIPDKSVDLILCDLPYGVTDCKWDVIIPPELLWDAYKRIIKDNGAIILF